MTVRLFAVYARVRHLLAFALGLMLACLTLNAHAERAVLKVSAIPDEAPTELLRKFKPLGEYLQARLDMDVQFVPVADYPAVVEALAAERVDLAWLGGFTYVQAHLKSPAVQPLVQREEDRHFTSHFITGNSDVNTLADLKGKSFAFGSVSSTSGHLMPRFFMLQDHKTPEDFFGTIGYSGAHDATVAWVQAGKVDGGVLNSSVWKKLLAAGKVDTSKVRVVSVSPEFIDYTWTVRGGIDAGLRDKLRDAFLALDSNRPEHKAILDLQAASRFVPVSADAYGSIENAARAAALIK